MLTAETMEGALDKSEFMEVFYTECIENLIAPVGGSSSEQDATQPPQQQQSGSKGSSTAEAAQPAAAAAAKGNSSAGGGAEGSKSSSGSSKDKVVPASTIGLIVDLLCFCVQHHAFWAKYHVLR